MEATREVAARRSGAGLGCCVAAAYVILGLALVGFYNPWNLVVVDRVLNHLFIALTLTGVLLYVMFIRSRRRPDARTPTVGRAAIVLASSFWLGLSWVLGLVSAPVALVVAPGLPLLVVLGVNFRRNHLAWPVDALLVPVLVIALMAPVAGVLGIFVSSHGEPYVLDSSTSFQTPGLRIDREDTFGGGCSSVTNWLRAGEGLSAREVHIGGNCTGFKFAGPNAIENSCYRTDARSGRGEFFVGRRVVFDPETLTIVEDSGRQHDNC